MQPPDETIWQGQQVTLRASRPKQTIRTEDHPYRPDVRDDTEDFDEVYSEYRMPVTVRKYNQALEPTRVSPLRFALLVVGIIIMATILAIAITTFISPAISRWNDDRTYGYPRTMHTRAVVGHGTTQDPYSDFTAENINGNIYVIEIPEADPSQRPPQTYLVTRYGGADRDDLAVTNITFTDQNGDGKPDMVVMTENGSAQKAGLV
jgi:hypothetical protein